MKALKNKHRGRRCFIIANGPSLKNMNLSHLKDEITIGMNRIYLNQNEMGFIPTYLLVADVKIQLKQFADELKDVNSTKIFNWAGKKYFRSNNKILYYLQTFKPSFAQEIESGVYGGHSVTYVCLQLAYYLGCSEVILIGKDHSYAEQGVPGQEIKSDGNEQNHFINGYYKKGMTWKIPDYKGEELAYQLAKDNFENSGRKVLDATKNGKLNIFQKIDFDTFWK
ncbi:MAG: DUF115 domain-containing protein [Melioribacteraceae bacterium]|nr:DUF115 domain-containing protein [Melioribacteraceae bacterium]MCF8414143.1 DUF115 domain-containing protein [Melioribacteraceae bacterium]